MIRWWVGVWVCLGLACGAAAQPVPRQLAAGVLTVIPPDHNESETFSGPRQMAELVQGVPGLAWEPIFDPKSQTLAELAGKVVYRRNVWCLEFSFKPLRMMAVDLPQPSGRLESKLVWYLAYRVRNMGSHLNPVAEPDAWGHNLYDVQLVNHGIRFFPQFVLQCFDLDKAYVDRVIPLAMKQIQSIEDPHRTFYNSVEISQIEIPVSTDEEDHSVWGIATWVDVDPRTDFFGLFVQRLSNAYQWRDPEGALKPGDPPGTGRVFAYKTLQLNFWRPGDAVREHQSEIRFGMPAIEDVEGGTARNQAELLKLYRVPERRDHQWVYRS